MAVFDGNIVRLLGIFMIDKSYLKPSDNFLVHFYVSTELQSIVGDKRMFSSVSLTSSQGIVEPKMSNNKTWWLPYL